MDRENLDNVYGELLSGYYDDSDEAGRDLGHLTSTDYLMNGSITRTATGYTLQIKITKTADKMTAASYSENCTFAELDNLTGIRRASLELLQKMGVELTERSKIELTGAAAENHVNAQAALARGITAQKNGTIVEALSYYYEAAGFDNSLLEASSRASVIAADISSGSIGENVRNDIQRRKEWQKLLAEAEDFYKKHLPFEIIYDPALTQGAVDYRKETVDLSCSLTMRPTGGFTVLENIKKGVAETGKMEEWDFAEWPLPGIFSEYHSGRGKYRNPYYAASASQVISIVAGLFDEKGKQISSCNLTVTGRIEFVKLGDKDYKRGKLPLPKGYTFYDDSYNEWYLDILDVTRFSVNIKNEHITFSAVSAGDITGNLTVKIISVNGIDAETAGKTGYIRISTGKVVTR
jgi:hypothetical protein